MTKAERAIFEIHIRGSIDDVWHEITKTDVPQECFFNMLMDTPGGVLDVGKPIRMRTANGRFTGAIGDVLIFDPPRCYSHTFRFTHLDDPACIVTYELKAANGGVDFRMTLDDLTPGTKSAKQMTQGGTMIVNTLKAMVENGRPSLGTRAAFAFFRAIQFTSPASTRSEHWPLDS